MGRRSSSRGSRGGTFGSVVGGDKSVRLVIDNPVGVYLGRKGKREVALTYSLGLESLDDGEGPGVVDVLHDEPADGLPVLGVDAGGLDELGLEAVDGVGVVVGVEVDGDCVDHFGGFLGGLGEVG